jgi:hypothetical protein
MESDSNSEESGGKHLKTQGVAKRGHFKQYC